MLAGTYRVNIRWSHPAIASGDPVWRKRSASGGGVGHSGKNPRRSHLRNRQRRKRDLGDEEGRQRRRRPSRRFRACWVLMVYWEASGVTRRTLREVMGDGRQAEPGMHRLLVYCLCECKSYGLLQFEFGILASVSRNAPQSRYGVGTIDNGIDRPALARPTLSLLKCRNGTAQFVPNPLSLFHANLSCSATLDTVERSGRGSNVRF